VIYFLSRDFVNRTTRERGRIWRHGDIEIEQDVIGSSPDWGIAIAIRTIGSAAATGKIAAPRRLGELPNARCGETALRGRRRIFPNHAAWRRRAGIVVNEISREDGQALVNVIRSRDRLSLTFVDLYSGTVNSRDKTL
jgi:hypothetical protein